MVPGWLQIVGDPALPQRHASGGLSSWRRRRPIARCAFAGGRASGCMAFGQSSCLVSASRAVLGRFHACCHDKSGSIPWPHGTRQLARCQGAECKTVRGCSTCLRGLAWGGALRVRVGLSGSARRGLSRVERPDAAGMGKRQLAANREGVRFLSGSLPGWLG